MARGRRKMGRGCWLDEGDGADRFERGSKKKTLFSFQVFLRTATYSYIQICKTF